MPAELPRQRRHRRGRRGCHRPAWKYAPARAAGPFQQPTMRRWRIPPASPAHPQIRDTDAPPSARRTYVSDSLDPACICRHPVSPLRLLIARQHVVRPSQGDRKSKLRNSWAQLHRLVDDALLLVVVAQLDIAGEREVLAQREALEAVVGQDAAQVRMTGEEDAVQVEGFALEPVGAGKTPRWRAPASSSSVSTLTRTR